MVIVLNKKKLQILGIVFLLVLTFFIMIPSHFGRKVNGEIMFFLTLNGIWWLVLLVKALKKQPYSLEIMHWTFFLFFCFFAILVQYLSDDYPWNISLGESTILQANILLTVWTACVLIGKKIAVKIHFKKKSHNWGFEGDSCLGVLFIMTAVNVWSVGNRVMKIGLLNMLARGTNLGIKYAEYKSLSMLISHSLQAVSYFSMVLSILLWKRNKKVRYFIFIILNAVCLIIGCFPLGMARYAVAVIYLGILLTSSDKLKKNRYFMILFIVAFIILLPLFNSWRTIAIFQASIGEAVSKVFMNLSNIWLAEDYDAFTLYAMSIEHITKHGIGGNHLLSILFFWVPRSLWPEKALSGSYEMAVARGMGFTNLSCPFPAEGILDGGIMGLILFGIFIGMLIQIIDEGCWRDYDNNKNMVRPAELIYPVLVIFFFFLCRGDMFYTFAYLCCYLFVWIVIVILAKKPVSAIK